MGCRILIERDYACFYCSTSMVAFGPLMADEEEAESFMKWLPDDPRVYEEKKLLDLFSQFQEEREVENDRANN